MSCALQSWGWKLNNQYLKLDGQTSTACRRKYIRRFADENGPKASSSPITPIPYAHNAVHGRKVRVLKPGCRGGI